jgi:hypothetical protein
MGFELHEEEADAQKTNVPGNLEDLESRMDQAIRLKWATDFSRSTASKNGPVNGNVVNREFHFVRPDYGCMHFVYSSLQFTVEHKTLSVDNGTPTLDALFAAFPSHRAILSPLALSLLIAYQSHLLILS